MKKFIVSFLSFCLIMTGSVTVKAFASSQIKPSEIEHKERIGISYDYIQNKLKLSKTDMDKIKADRHGLVDYLTEKNWKKEDIWALMKEAKFAAIDEKVKAGELTREKGEEIKNRIETRKDHKRR